MDLIKHRMDHAKTRKELFLSAAVLFVIGIVFTGTRPSYASVVYSGDTDKVSIEDGADILSDEEEENLLGQAEEVFSETGFEIRLVTVDDTGGRTTQTFAENYFENMTDDGPAEAAGEVCVIDMDNREYYLATSGEVRYYINDDRLDTLLDNAGEYISDGDYAGTLSSMLDDTLACYHKGIADGTRIYNEDTGESEVYHRPRSITKGKIAGALAAAAAAFLAVFAGVKGSYSMRFEKGDGFQTRENVRLDLTRKTDLLVNHIVTSRRLPRDNDSHSGGPTSTTHTTSGGYSAGGGGRSF